MNKDSTFTLTGVIEKILYYNEENQYSIALLTNGHKICGTYSDTHIEKLIGEEITIQGRWSKHDKYGLQFEFDIISIKEAEIFFFLTKIVKGISETLAKRLLKKFSEDELIEILDNTPDKLLTVKGIKDKKLHAIIDSWKTFKHLRELSAFLSSYTISSRLLTDISNTFQHNYNLIDTIKENPYILTQVNGIGFKKADQIAFGLGIDQYSPKRIMAAMHYVLKHYCDQEGNSSISESILFTQLDHQLGLSNQESLYHEALTLLRLEETICETSKQRYTTQTLYKAEKKILEFFTIRQNSVKHSVIVNTFEDYINHLEASLGFKLNTKQKEAVNIINEGNQTLTLIGYAGTGKSTSSRAILNLLETIIHYDDIICIALSGIATQRIADATGYASQTIQSLLVQYKEQDFFPHKVILLDEASMVNSVTFYQVISKIDPESWFIILGDDGQLPAIGAGNILSNIIEYKLTSLCQLTDIYRQKNDQAIAFIANDIRQGHIPSYKGQYKDFLFIADNIQTIHHHNQENINQTILNHIITISSQYITPFYTLIEQKQINQSLTFFQLITPIKSGILGVNNLNTVLQTLFNPKQKHSFITNDYCYKLMDKVIHIKNENMPSQTLKMYKNKSNETLQKRVYNGQLGMIIKLDIEEEKCLVLYPNDDMIVHYNLKELTQLLRLAYCLTIHKTQGMEYQNVIIPISASHSMMHTTKLLYTAISRAKTMCYLIGEENAFTRACQTFEATKRESVINDIMSMQIKHS